MLSAPTRIELAVFTGRTAQSFPAFADEALAQAALLFSIVTKRRDYPEDADQLKLAKFAILEMADRLILEQPYASIKSGPFQTETMGSYSYSKATQTSRTAQQGIKTGLFWWDVAIDELSLPGSSVLSHGSVAVEHDGLVQDIHGNYLVRDVTEMDDDGPSPPYIRIS